MNRVREYESMEIALRASEQELEQARAENAELRRALSEQEARADRHVAIAQRLSAERPRDVRVIRIYNDCCQTTMDFQRQLPNGQWPPLPPDAVVWEDSCVR